VVDEDQSQPTVGELRFRAMGSDGHVIVVGGPGGLAERARDRVDELEQRWSRFVSTSEVCELARRAGTAVAVSPETLELVRRAEEATRLTGGSFDATVLGDVIRAGYDRTFESLGPDVAAGRSALTLGSIAIDGNRVTLPAGTGFDPGGIGKGLAADLVIAELFAAGAEGACVNLGGDLRVAGRSPEGEGWTVGIEHPWLASPLCLVGVADGAVATSTTLRRRWETDAGTRHHLIDPATGEPSATDLALVSVIADRGWVAEVLAKAVLLRGSAHPFDLIGGSAVAALAVTDTGTVLASDGYGAFLGGAVLPDRISPP
jgi:thiamine biosynthesis lipoprotein